MAVRILAISDLYPPDIRGGAEISTSEAVDGLRERGHEVVVATGASGPALAHVRCCLEYRPSPRWQGGRVLAGSLAGRSAVPPRLLQPAERGCPCSLLAELVPDVVYVGGIGGVGPCSILRALRDQPAPVVAHLRDYWLLTLLYGGSEFSGLRLPWLKRLLIGLDARRDLRLTSMIALSQTLRDRYLEAGFPPDVIEVIPQGMRLSPVERRQEPRSMGSCVCCSWAAWTRRRAHTSSWSAWR